MSNADQQLRDLAKCHTESATATSLMLKNIFEVLTVMSKSISQTELYMAQVKEARESFYRYATKGFVVVFFALLAIIALLLKELNVKGADAVKQVGDAGLSTVRPITVGLPALK